MAATTGIGILAMAAMPLGTGCLHRVAGPVAALAHVTGPYCHKGHLPTTSAPLVWRGTSSEREWPLKDHSKSCLLLPFPPSKAQMGVRGKGRTRPPCGQDTFSKGSPVPGRVGGGTELDMKYHFSPHQGTHSCITPCTDSHLSAKGDGP